MSLKINKTSVLNPVQKESICHLWNKEYPLKLAITLPAFDEFLGTTSEHTHYLITSDESGLIGWAFTFNRSGERWFAMIIDGAYQRQGLGHLLLNLIKDKEHKLNGWVIDHPNDVKRNGDPYPSPLAFYIRNGFTAHPETRMEDEKISAVKIEWRK
jgi:GNAT superfamily N-acetyltransferase